MLADEEVVVAVHSLIKTHASQAQVAQLGASRGNQTHQSMADLWSRAVAFQVLGLCVCIARHVILICGVWSSEVVPLLATWAT